MTAFSWPHMKQPKDETISIRTSAGIKTALKVAAEREHRSLASMIEVLVLDYAHKNGLKTSASQPIANKKSKA
jgi:hypothetical protein